MNRSCRTWRTIYLLRSALLVTLMLVGNKANCAEDSATSEDSLSIAATLSNSFRAAADRASSGVVTVYTFRGPRMTATWRRRMSTRSTDDAMHSASGLRDDQGTGIVIDRQAIDDTFRPEQLFDEPIPRKNYKFSLFRNGKSVVVDVQMGPPPRTHTIEETHATAHSNRATEYFDGSLGLGVDTLTNDLSRQLDFPENQLGVLVTDVASGSLAYMEGIAAGVVVLRISSHSVQNLNDYKQAMSTSPSGKTVLMLVESSNGRHLVVLDKY